MARHISYFNLFDLPRLNTEGATSPRLSPAPWNTRAYKINGVLYVEELEEPSCSEYEEYENLSFEEIEEKIINDYPVVEYLTPRGWTTTPIWEC